MNLRLFSMALLVSAVPIFSLAESAGISLNKGDFLSAEKITRDGESLVSVKLSKSGKAKFKKLNKIVPVASVHVEIADVASDFKVRDAITGDELEMGPYANQDADHIVSDINQK